MNIYCEGSAAAEIIFSLTGGREGRLMSYVPPVIIEYPVKGIKAKHYNFFTGIVWGEVIFKDRLTIPSGDFEKPFWSELNDSLKVSRYAYRLSHVYKRRGVTSVYTSLKIEEWDKQTGNISTIYQSKFLGEDAIGETFMGNRALDNALLIRDSQGILYDYEIPEGFTPTWQVTCIGCQQGECAGSNGEGGVVCMDCQQMDRDLQAIKKSLSR